MKMEMKMFGPPVLDESPLQDLYVLSIGVEGSVGLRCRECLEWEVSLPSESGFTLRALHEQINFHQVRRHSYATDAWKEQYTTDSGQVLQVHPRRSCLAVRNELSYCVIHRPMPGPWDGWPTNWNWDFSVMERTCPHDFQHPALESHPLAFHVCDGCCRVPDPVAA